MASSKDISKIVDDVGYIITNKLKDVLLPIVESRTSTETAILNIPFVQDIMNENRKLKIQVAELETKLAIVRENYKREFLSKLNAQYDATLKQPSDNNINLEIKEVNIHKKDYDVSEIEKEIIELNKDEMESIVTSDDDLDCENLTDDMESQSIPDDCSTRTEAVSEDEAVSENEEKFKEMQHFIENEPLLCKKAVENYRLYYNMNDSPSVETVYNSSAGLKAWSESTLCLTKENQKIEDEPEEEEDEPEEEDEDEEDKEEEEEDELEVEEIMIKGKLYYTSSSVDGDIYRVGEDGDVEEIVGKFKKSKAIFF